jgi:hypothetical protein
VGAESSDALPGSACFGLASKSRSLYGACSQVRPPCAHTRHPIRSQAGRPGPRSVSLSVSLSVRHWSTKRSKSRRSKSNFRKCSWFDTPGRTTRRIRPCRSRARTLLGLMPRYRAAALRGRTRGRIVASGAARMGAGTTSMVRGRPGGFRSRAEARAWGSAGGFTGAVTAGSLLVGRVSGIGLGAGDPAGQVVVGLGGLGRGF